MGKGSLSPETNWRQHLLIMPRQFTMEERWFLSLCTWLWSPTSTWYPSSLDSSMMWKECLHVPTAGEGYKKVFLQWIYRQPEQEPTGKEVTEQLNHVPFATLQHEVERGRPNNCYTGDFSCIPSWWFPGHGWQCFSLWVFIEERRLMQWWPFKAGLSLWLTPKAGILKTEATYVKHFLVHEQCFAQ